MVLIMLQWVILVAKPRDFFPFSVKDLKFILEVSNLRIFGVGFKIMG